MRRFFLIEKSIYKCIYLLYMIISKVKKWGNSLAIRLPKEAVDSLNIKDGSQIAIHTDIKKHLLKIIPKERKALTFDEMVKRINKNNIHELIDWGVPRGGEFW